MLAELGAEHVTVLDVKPPTGRHDRYLEVNLADKLIDWNVSETNGRLVTAREVATVLAFLGSDAAAYVNGVNLLVDAGFTAAMTTGQVDFAALA